MRWLLLLLFLPLQVLAATYHVRTDGGTALQCDGKTDAAVSASKSCAWSHPFVALPTSGTSVLKAGDTLRISAGTYRMGFGVPAATGCSSYYPWDCYMRPVPGGVAITGTGAKLVGVERAYYVLNLASSQDVTVSGLEITDGLACGELLPLLPCKRDAYPYGDWAGVGIYGKGAKNIALTDVNVHGLANRGIVAGGIADWTLTRVKINGNAWAGWDGDVGTGSSNSGKIAFTDSEIAWNGCIEGLDGKAVKCHGQNNGGYGDGLGTAATGGHWSFTNAQVHHNTSDGIDLLYANGTGAIAVAGGRFEGNAGNQLKTKGPATIVGATVTGNCAYFKDYPALGLLSGDHCRAAGNALSIALTAGAAVTIDQVTASGQGDCLLLVGGGTTASKVTTSRSRFTGGKDATDTTGQDLSCGFYADAAPASYAWLSNTWSGVKAGTAPADTGTAPPVDPAPPIEPVPPTCPSVPVCPALPDNSAAKAAVRAEAAKLRASADALEAAAGAIK